MLMSLVVFGGQAYSVQRRVTLAATTVANIFAQANNTNSSTITAAELSQILAYPNLILYPYSAPASRSKSRNCSSPSTGTARRPARSRAAGPTPTEPSRRPASNCRSTPRSPPPFPGRATTYVVLGEVQYPFQPTGIYFSVGTMTLHDSIIMIPRVASPINVTGSTHHG